ncbi:hypothetical protein RJ639_019792 [Escallonia herrerae]|uniref:Uncharacterized protein n=1 Tax=Escallonia herrerae TaxID=1293975 RepID=A0AA88V9U0_9ASTE|nr:hypothetical protein RJ639_019792 [Escallonia herrerae]
MNGVSLVSFWFCNKDDHSVYRINVVGDNILKVLLNTGTSNLLFTESKFWMWSADLLVICISMGKGRTGSSGGDNWDVYLQLSVTILAAFSRIPEIASSPDMVSKIPLIVEIMSEESGLLLLEECYEFLLLVSTANDDGVRTLYKSGGMNVLATHMSTFPDGSHAVKLGMRLFQLVLSKLPLEVINREYPAELSMVVAIIAKQFAVLHDTLKFEALHLLTAVLHSKDSLSCVPDWACPIGKESRHYHSITASKQIELMTLDLAPVHDALRLMENDIWSTYIRIGVVAILQNRVAPAERLQALMLAESVISIVGEGWLIGQMNLPDAQDFIPADRGAGEMAGRAWGGGVVTNRTNPTTEELTLPPPPPHGSPIALIDAATSTLQPWSAGKPPQALFVGALF